jgi:ankyrin repeat protein
MASATIRLGELISTNNRGNTCPQYTPTLLDKIDKLLDEGADINIVVCVYRGSNDLVYRLLGSNPKIDSTFRPLSNGWTAADDASNFLHLLFLAVIATPLIDAADQDDREAMSFLARRGARIEPILESLSASLIRTDRLWDPFFLPGKDDRYKSIQRILNLADPAHKIVQGWVWAAFHNVATSGGDENLALMLLRHGAQPTDGELGSTALQALIDIACRHQIQPATISTSSPEFISVVFLDNMDLCALVPRDSSYQTARGPCGITPLILSAGSASVAMCEFLLNCGANPNEFDDFGMTALMDAIYFGHEEAVSLLLARGAETKRTESGSIKSSLPASRFLPAGNDDQWNERVKYAGMCKQRGWHALHLAAHQGRLVALRALCNVSASIATPDDDGNFPLDIALLNSQDMAAYFLLERKCPFDTRSQAASRLLTQAITDCKHSIVTQLLESGVLPSPCFHFSEEYTKRDNSSKTKEHLGKSLPLRASKMSPLKDYGNAPVDLCLDCFTHFKTAKFSPASKSDPNCKSCRLLADCARDSPDQLPKLLYSMKDGAKDDELVTMSSKLIFRHPIKEVQGMTSKLWLRPYLS